MICSCFSPSAMAFAIPAATSASDEKARVPITVFFGLEFTSATGAKSRLNPY